MESQDLRVLKKKAERMGDPVKSRLVVVPSVLFPQRKGEGESSTLSQIRPTSTRPRPSESPEREGEGEIRDSALVGEVERLQKKVRDPI